jgi:DNA-binding GntR family transcriptional regulator
MSKPRLAQPQPCTRSEPALSVQVYQQLLDRMLDGRIRPGQLITRRDIAAELGVSIAPVAEAFAALDHEGLLETLPRTGTRVRVFTAQDVREQAVVRLALETQVARLVCGEPVRRHRRELRPFAATLDRKDCTGVQRWEADVAFHQRLAELTDCNLLVQHLRGVLRLSFIAAQQVMGEPAPSLDRASRHMPLLTQLMLDDPTAAEAAMRAHLLAGNVGRVHADPPAPPSSLVRRRQ